MSQPAELENALSTNRVALERKPQAKPRHKGVDGAEWKQIVRPERPHLSHYRLRIRNVEEVDRRDHMPPLVEGKVSCEPQVQQTHARQPQRSSRLQYDGFADRGALTVRNTERLRGLDGISRVVLEVNTGVDLPGELVTAVHLEDISRVLVQDVVLAVDILVWVGEVIAKGIVPGAEV